MLIEEKSLILEEVIHQPGFESMTDFALKQARQYLTQQINETQSNIDFFEKKYSYNYTDFCLHFHEIPIDMFEKEDDSMDWKFAIEQLKLFQDRLLSIA